MKKITLIIPCYNEEEMIHLLYKELCAVAKKLEIRENVQYETELLFIDDGSKDRTLKFIKELAMDDDRVEYISFSRNFGKEAAMYAGFCNATGDYVAVLDADMQDPPSLLPEMVNILEGGDYDSVAARRVHKEGRHVIHSCFAKMFYKIINKSLPEDIMEGARDFRLMKREIVQVIIEMKESNRFSKGIFEWIGFRNCWYEYESVERAAGTTKWNFRSLFRYSLDGIFNFSYAPLNLIFGMGIIFVINSIVLIAAIIIINFTGSVSLYEFGLLIGIIILFNGLQLLCLGIIGHYISKIYQESKHRPHYVARETSDENMKKIF